MVSRIPRWICARQGTLVFLRKLLLPALGLAQRTRRFVLKSAFKEKKMTYSGHKNGPFTATLVALLALVPASAFAQNNPVAGAPEKIQEMSRVATDRFRTEVTKWMSKVEAVCQSVACSSALSDVARRVAEHGSSAAGTPDADASSQSEVLAAMGRTLHVLSEDHPEAAQYPQIRTNIDRFDQLRAGTATTAGNLGAINQYSEPWSNSPLNSLIQPATLSPRCAGGTQCDQRGYNICVDNCGSQAVINSFGCLACLAFPFPGSAICVAACEATVIFNENNCFNGCKYTYHCG